MAACGRVAGKVRMSCVWHGPCMGSTGNSCATCGHNRSIMAMTRCVVGAKSPAVAGGYGRSCRLVRNGLADPLRTRYSAPGTQLMRRQCASSPRARAASRPAAGMLHVEHMLVAHDLPAADARELPAREHAKTPLSQIGISDVT